MVGVYNGPELMTSAKGAATTVHVLNVSLHYLVLLMQMFFKGVI